MLLSKKLLNYLKLALTTSLVLTLSCSLSLARIFLPPQIPTWSDFVPLVLILIADIFTYILMLLYQRGINNVVENNKGKVKGNFKLLNRVITIWLTMSLLLIFVGVGITVPVFFSTHIPDMSGLAGPTLIVLVAIQSYVVTLHYLRIVRRELEKAELYK